MCPNCWIRYWPVSIFGILQIFTCYMYIIWIRICLMVLCDVEYIWSGCAEWKQYIWRCCLEANIFLAAWEKYIHWCCVKGNIFDVWSWCVEAKYLKLQKWRKQVCGAAERQTCFRLLCCTLMFVKMHACLVSVVRTNLKYKYFLFCMFVSYKKE